MPRKQTSAGRRLAVERLEHRQLLSAGALSSRLLLCSSRAGDEPLVESAVAPPPAADPLVLPPITSPAINQSPTGADKSLTTPEDTPLVLSVADFGFSDANQQWIASGAPSPSLISAANVLVLYNVDSSAGIEIAQYYAQVYPGVRLLGISGVNPNNENITADDYLSIIRPQVLAALDSSVDVIVTTKGLPLRIQVTQPAPPLLSTYVDSGGVTRSIYSWKSFSSLESELTTVDRVASWMMMGDQSYNANYHFTRNPYYWQNGPFRHSTYGTRLAARLDGYSVAEVKAAIDRAQRAYMGPPNDPNSPFYFVVDNDPTRSYWGHMARLPDTVLVPGGWPMIYDNTTAFVSTAPGPVIAYDSHGVWQASTPSNYLLYGLNFALADGAVFGSWESYNAYSFNAAPTTNQGQIAQWLQVGGTAGVGYVEEPTATRSTITNEDLMYRMLLSGYTLAEAAWNGNLQLSFVNTVVGDPLMRWRPLVAGQHNLAAVKICALPAAGSLTLAGVPVTVGQTVSASAIAAGQLEFMPAADAFGTNYASFTFQVQDSGGTTAGGSDLDPYPNRITLHVTAVDDPLVVDLNGPNFGSGHVTFWSGAGPVLATLNSAAIASAQATELVSLSVAITAGGHPGNVLSATPQGNVAVSYNAAAGVLQLSGLASVDDYQAVLRSVRYDHASTGPGVPEVRMTYLATDALGSTASAQGVVKILNANSGVVGRHLFYNESGTASPVRYDGNNPGLNAVDDQAIAIDKTAYLAGGGPASFANLSSFSKGINGLMVDLGGLGSHGAISAADFSFRIGNNNSPALWSAAPSPVAVSVRMGAGVGGSDRVSLAWANGAIKGGWLQVVVKANAITGLPQLPDQPAGYGDVFYFGSAPGDTGPAAGSTYALVNATDELGVRNNQATLISNQPITNLYDLNRDARVDATDILLARDNMTTILNATRYLNIPGGSLPNGPQGAQLDDADQDDDLVSLLADDVMLADALVQPSTTSGSGADVGAALANREPGQHEANETHADLRRPAIQHQMQLWVQWKRRSRPHERALAELFGDGAT